MDGWMDGWMMDINRWMDIDGWIQMDGWIYMDNYRWMDGWMTNITQFYLHFPFSKYNKQLHIN